jgi:hypothetical protein
MIEGFKNKMEGKTSELISTRSILGPKFIRHS